MKEDVQQQLGEALAIVNDDAALASENDAGATPVDPRDARARGEDAAWIKGVEDLLQEKRAEIEAMQAVKAPVR